MAREQGRALVVRGPGEVGLESRPMPVADGAQLLVHPAAVGLCGTDLEIIDGTLDPAYVRYPVVLGHEWTGTIAAGSAGVLPPGTRVVVEGIVPCRVCVHCVAGRTNLCLTYDEIGFTRDGAAADHVLVPIPLVHPLGAEVSLDDAVLVEPTAVVLRALGRLRLRPGARVLVVGDGTVALLAVHLLGLWSPADVVVLGRREPQRSLALRAGAGRFEVDPASARGFDVALEAAGSIEAVQTALAATRRGGQVGLLGLPPHGRTAAIPVDEVVNSDLTVVASFGYTCAAWRDAVTLVNAGLVRPGFLVTHRLPLSDWQQAVAALRDGDAARGKVVLTISSGAQGSARLPDPGA